ncbi:EFR1 family ferrodoxin [Bacteroidales bacterium OttesenSCG-928-C19]|nr:EFR1 family ferrodoxin [Bacteroidales bacterium OttesenSCG-928-C19]
MVFYFSGTGNSLWVAKKIGEAFDERLISISEELNRKDTDYRYQLMPNEKVFFVFPVHSWGPAVLVYRFLKEMSFDNYTTQPIYAVCVCGDNCGDSGDIIRKLLKDKSFSLTKSFSIQMLKGQYKRNTLIFLSKMLH